MKKAAVISIAAFYLLAATGMFACIVHCAAESLLTGIKTAHVEEAESDHRDSSDQDHHKASSKKNKDCKGEEGCSCCDQHGTYVVKENISPTLNLKVPEILLVGCQSPHFNYTALDKVISLSYTWPESHAPPGKSDRHLYIKIRSLLI